MALLQIAEPNQSSNPHEHKYGIGIDLGTTRSLVGLLRSGKVSILASEEDSLDDLLSSTVAYGESDTLVGQKAVNADVQGYTIIRSVKRFMGRSISDIKFPHPYELKGEADSMPSFKTHQGDKTPVEISSEILTALKIRAEQACDENIQGAVITVPAYFDEAQRQATRDAAKLANLPVLRLLNEPTAAAIAYGLDNKENNQLFLIYDLGGGTFDVSILRLNKGIFEVLATGGHTALGGDDVDRLIAKWIKHNANKPEITADEQEALELYARSIKEQLTDSASVDISWQGWEGNLTSDELTKIIQPVIDISTNICKRVLRDAKITVEQLNELVLVGGSTRMPNIQSAIKRFFGKEPLCSHNPDEVVAIGASILANQLVGNAPTGETNLLLDVTPLSLGIETMGGLVEVIIPRNTPIPISKQQTFTTYQDGQNAMKIHVVQGERDQVEHCRSLAEFKLSGIPAMKAGVAKIDVTYSIDADGLLRVSASENTTSITSQIEVKPAYGLSDDDMTRILKESQDFANHDKELRSFLEAQLEVNREILALESAQIEFGNLLSDSDKSDLNDTIAQIKQLNEKTGNDINANTRKEFDDLVKKLKPLSDKFASIIMNTNIKKGLAGSHTDDWS